MSVRLEVRTKLLKQMSSLLLGTVVLAWAAHAAVPNASFNAPQSFAVPNGPSFPYAVAVGDLNGDGKADMAVAGGGYVSILLGNGDGTFAPAVSYAAGSLDTLSVAIADFNGDGKPDLALANPNSPPATVSILLGNGDGTFQPQVSYAVGTAGSSYALAVADFNRDGKADLAVVTSSDDVYILLGTGDGGFQAGVGYHACPSLTGIAIGDFNGDGSPDVVGTCGRGSAAVLLGNGDGTLQPAVSYLAGHDVVAVAVGDFNGDGRADLALATHISGYIFILLGNGNGTFQPPVKLPYFLDVFAVAVGDFNGDGKADLAVAGVGNVSILLGKGDGSFKPPTTFVVCELPYGEPGQVMALGDFNGDGALDVAVSSAGSISVLLGNGRGGFPRPVAFPAGEAGTFVAVGDFNGDGKPDLVEVGRNHSVSMLLGNGDGTFQAPVSDAAGTGGIFVAVGDFNGDGKLDLVLANLPNQILVLLGNGDGTFQPPASYAVEGHPISIAIGDFNGDGKPDLAVATRGVGTVSVLLGKGDGTFLPQVRYRTVGEPSFVAVGDFNGDGNADLAVVESEGTPYGVAILMGNGSGGFAAPVIYELGTVGDGTAGSVAVADFNGDGHQDLAVASYQGGNISILLGKGDGTFGPQVSYAIPFASNYGNQTNYLAVGDFNGDGVPDLATATDGWAALLLGNGDGTFTVQAVAYLAGGPSLAAGDFNGDGKLDLAVPRNFSVAILTNTTP
jgi:VCBS repeat protein/FG-GAP repeat protein